MKNKIFDELKDKKILLLGFGKEGKSSYQFIRSMDQTKKIGIANLDSIENFDFSNDPYLTFYIGEDYLKACFDYDIIIKGPGVIIKDYLDGETKSKITCQTDLFLKYSKNQTIGITGTKGKSTTSSLLYHILQKIGKSSVLVGNIGIPVFDIIDQLEENTICVLELGVHQLEFMKHSPNIAVILDIYEEHLDHYVSMDAYVNAKRNIYLYQTKKDIFLAGNSPYLQSLGKIYSTVYRNQVLSENCYFMDQNHLVIYKGKEKILVPRSKIRTNLKGEHNLKNILTCLTIISILGFDLKKSIQSLMDFKGLPHRLEYVGTYHGILFYDDAIATSIPSVISAIATLENVDTLILGGMDRGLDYLPLVTYLEKSSVRNILLLPETNQKIEKLFKDLKSSLNVISVLDMEHAVSFSFEITDEGKICLLSPAAASYNAYKNFEAKGNHFQNLLKKEGKENDN